uniref:hypothetical protein n=1 Tax=Streptosporangium sp. CA-235898 TaxID=3240073 RepID=UPI003F49A48B
MWNLGFTGRVTDRTEYDDTRLSAPCAAGRHTGCQDLNCSCVEGTCTHARARAK